MSAYAPCQVCGRSLSTRRNGLVKPHKASRSHEPYSYCRGTGFRHARWEAGQHLRHHAGDLWLVVIDVGGLHGDYLIRCLEGREKGRQFNAHGEYMHRHGWTPVEVPAPA